MRTYERNEEARLKTKKWESSKETKDDRNLPTMIVKGLKVIFLFDCDNLGSANYSY